MRRLDEQIENLQGAYVVASAQHAKLLADHERVTREGLAADVDAILANAGAAPAESPERERAERALSAATRHLATLEEAIRRAKAGRREALRVAACEQLEETRDEVRTVVRRLLPLVEAAAPVALELQALLEGRGNGVLPIEHLQSVPLDVWIRHARQVIRMGRSR